MNKLSERIRNLRQEKGYSQQALADALGTSKSSINMYERGEREPGVPMLIQMSSFFRVDLDYLVGNSDEKGLEWHSRGQRFDPAYLHQRRSPQTIVNQWLAGFLFCLRLPRKIGENSRKSSHC